jgi:hypothetical protein
MAENEDHVASRKSRRSHDRGFDALALSQLSTLTSAKNMSWLRASTSHGALFNLKMVRFFRPFGILYSLCTNPILDAFK